MIIAASVAVKWFIAEADSDIAVDLVGRHPLRAPPLLVIEVGKAIWKKMRRGELLEQRDTLARHAGLRDIVEIVEGRSSDLALRALEMALQIDHAIYDCVYLALAEAEDEVLITADTAFYRKLAATPLARHITVLGA